MMDDFLWWLYTAPMWALFSIIMMGLLVALLVLTIPLHRVHYRLKR